MSTAGRDGKFAGYARFHYVTRDYFETVSHSRLSRTFQLCRGIDFLHASRSDLLRKLTTSIAGLAAKDVIDAQVSVRILDEHIGQTLASIGFRWDRSISGDHVPPGEADSEQEWQKLFFVEAPGDRRANIHVRAAGRLNERYALLFRDYLRAHPHVAAAYAELKRRLSVSLAVPDDYADVKDPAVDLIYLAAEQWAAATGWALRQPPAQT